MSRSPWTCGERLDLQLPIIQAPMAGADSPALAAAVCQAGGLGSLGVAYSTPEEIEARSAALRALTSRPFGINLFVPRVDAAGDGAAAVRALEPYYSELGLPVPTEPAALPELDAQFDAVLTSGARVFSFTFGVMPRDMVDRAKRAGMLVMGTATTPTEAHALEQSGVDAVVIQGAEAGGHRGSHAEPPALVSTLPLLRETVTSVRVPVIASGGIMDGYGIAAVLAAGAAAAQLGTAFLGCPESGIPRPYRDALRTVGGDQTMLTRVFSGRLARGLRNRLSSDFEASSGAIAGFPLQHQLTRPLRQAAAERGTHEFLSLWAGQGVGMVRVLPASELVRELRREFEVARSALVGMTPGEHP